MAVDSTWKAVVAPSLDQIRTRLGDAVTGARPGLSAANQLCTACVDLLGVDGAAISMIFQGQSQGTFGSSSPASRRLDEHQFTFGEGPCLDAVASGRAVLVPDLDSPYELRWPLFAGEALRDGYRAVFALPVMLTSACVGALDLFRVGPGPLGGDQLTGGLLAAELASLPLLDLIAGTCDDADHHRRGHCGDRTDDPTGESGRQQTGGHEGDRGSDESGVDDDQDGWVRLAELDRVEVYQATGMLIVQLDVNSAEALARLRGHAVATGQTASAVAWAIVHGQLELDRDEHDQRSGHDSDGRHDRDGHRRDDRDGGSQEGETQ